MALTYTFALLSGNVPASYLDVNFSEVCEKSANLSDLTNAATARTNLGLGDMATQTSSNVSITGGNITGLASLTIANGGSLAPVNSDGAAIGSTTKMWADLFLASGGVINFNNGNYTITHSSGNLAFSGSLSVTGAVTSNARGTVTRVVEQTFTGSGTYTPTSGMLYAIIECVGGGGGGGGCANSTAGNQGGGGGGGGGGYSRKVVTAANVGASQVVTIGSAGTAGSSGNNNGGNGGDTSVGSLCIGKGGSGGQGAASNADGDNGAGGVAGTGDFTVPGAPGLRSQRASITTVYLPSGNGGSAAMGFGAGGNGGTTPVAASTGGAGQNYGGGGAGGKSGNGAGAAAGGAGAAGVVIITEYCS